MKKPSLFGVLFILCVTTFYCQKNFDPFSTSSDSEVPLSYTFHTSADSVTILSSPLFVVDRDTLSQNGGANSFANDLFDFTYSSYWDTRIRRELIISQGDSFRVRIQNCLVGKVWNFCIDSADQVSFSKDSLPVSDSLYDCLYTFKPTQACKGVIGFYERSDDSRGFIIGYTIDYREILTVRFDAIDWIYGLEENWSTLAVHLAGKSNAMKLKMESYGDGVISVHQIPLDSEGKFDITQSISFRYGIHDSLSTNTRIALYGTVGPPKIVTIKNPLSQ